MATNNFAEKAVRFTGVLDELYRKHAITAMLDSPALARQFVGANRIKLPKVSVDGAGTYDRDAGYAQGGVSVTYEEHTLKYDRGRKFRVDFVDNDESAFSLFRQVAAQYVRTREIPEVDAIRFMEICAAAAREETLGTVVEKDLSSSDKPLALLDEAEKILNEKEVPEEGRVLFCSGDFYALLKGDTAIARRLDVAENTGGIDRRVLLLDGMTPVIRVPRARFWSKVKLLDGSTGGETAGGYQPITSESKGINFIYGNKAAMQGVLKRNVSKIVTPDQNQSADAYDIFYRVHHDLIVRDNDTAALYVHTMSTAYTG